MADRYRAYTATGEVANSGDVGSDGKVAFDAGPETVVSTVVFYSGELDDEAVVSVVEVGSSGPIKVEAPE